MAIDSKVCIYGLVDPRTNHYRYIGRSINPRKRLQTQMAFARANKRKTYLHAWIRSLLNDGLKPIQHIIEIVPERRWREAEKYWIQYFKDAGYKLTNIAKGGKGSYGRKMSDAEKAMRSVSSQKRWDNATVEERKQHSDSLSKYWNSPEGKEKARQRTAERYEDPNERTKQSETMKVVTSTPEWKERASRKTKERYKDPAERRKTGLATKKMYEDNPELRIRQSINSKLRWEDPEYRKKCSVSTKKYWDNPENKKRQSEAVKRSWVTRRNLNVSN